MANKVRIGGLDFKLVRGHSRHEDLNTLGYMDSKRAEIGIYDDSVSEDIKKNTLIHEIVEAINDLNDLQLDHKDITVLGTSITQVLNDNPHIFKFNFKGVK